MKNYLDLQNTNDYSGITQASTIIKNNGTVIFPTETVYAIGANAFNFDAISKIFIAKGRDFSNPINILVNSISMVESIACNISEIEYKLMDIFFPGPFTLILEKNNNIPDILTANQNTVGVRMPNNKIALELISTSGVPIAAPSANISGKPSGTNLENIYPNFKDSVDFFIDSGLCDIGIESTIVKVIDNVPHILRPGSITKSDLIQVCGKVVDNYNDINSKHIFHKNNHYIPDVPCILLNYSNVSILENFILNNPDNTFLLFNETLNCFKAEYQNVINVGNHLNLDEFGKNIFNILNSSKIYNKIYIETVPEHNLGIAIMNRLKKASNGNYINL